MASTSANPQTVPITLRTSSPTSSFSIPNVPYLIPSNWKRSHLSTLVNRLLNSTTTAGDQDEVTTTTIPFDFIIDGNLLTGTIENYLKLKGESGESTLDIQYLPSTMPPKYQASFEQDDWISQVDANVDGWVRREERERGIGTGKKDCKKVAKSELRAAKRSGAGWNWISKKLDFLFPFTATGVESLKLVLEERTEGRDLLFFFPLTLLQVRGAYFMS